MPGRRARWALPLLLGLYVVAGVVYDLTVPVFEKPDESYHFFFAQHLAQGRGLPVQSAASADMPWSYEGSQPPLYYWLAGTAIRLFHLEGVKQVPLRNPHAAIGVADTVGNKNVYVHALGESLRTPLGWAVHLARWIALLMGTITVWATAKLCCELLCKQPVFAVLITAFAAFTPQFLFISTSVSNDSTVAATVTVGLWLLIRALKQGLRSLEAVVLVLACGLAGLAKLSGLLFVPLAAGVLMVAAWRDRKQPGPHGTVPPAALAAGSLLAAVLIAGWWYWRNWSLYGDWTGLAPMLGIIGRSSPPSFLQLRWELEGLRISYWALFGWFSILADEWVYRVLDVVLTVALAGLVLRVVVAALRAWREDERAGLRPGVGSFAGDWAPWLAVAAWPVLVFAGAIQTTVHMNVSQGRLLFPAIASIAVLTAVGVTTWVPRCYWRGFLVLASTLWVAWAFSLPPRIIFPAYELPTHGADVSLPPEATRLDLSYGATRLLGYRLSPDRLDRGDALQITLYWTATSSIKEAYSVSVKLLGRDRQLLASVDSYPGRGMYPANLWQPGEIVVDPYTLVVAQEADIPVLAEVWVDMYKYRDLDALPVTTPDGVTLAKPQIASVRVAPRPGPVAAQPLARFRDGIGLQKAAVEPSRLLPAEPLTVRLLWTCYATPSADYTVYLHLVPAGEVTEPLAQVDGPPRDGSYPTGVWSAADEVPDTHQLVLPASLPSGDYDLIVGLYNAETLARVPLADGSSDHWQLARLRFDGQVWWAVQAGR